MSGSQTVVSQDGDFSSPAGIARAANGDLFVVDETAVSSGALIHVDPTTGIQTVLNDVDFSDPFGIAIEADGTLLVTDLQLATVFRVNPTAGAATAFTSGGLLVNPTGVAVAPNGDIYVADLGAQVVIRVHPVTAAQTLVSSGGLFAQPMGVAVAGNGDLIVVDAGFFGVLPPSVIRVNPTTGAQATITTGGGLVGPTGIAIAGAPDLAVTIGAHADPIGVGRPLVYTVTATNNGPAAPAATGLTVALPAGATWVSTTTSQGSCVGTGPVTCALGILPSGATAAVTLVVIPTLAGPLVATATVTGSVADPVPGNDTATITTAATGRVTVTRAGMGGGTVQSLDGGITCGGDCTEVYAAGTGVTLQAVAAGGSLFAGWTGAGCTTGDCIVTVTADVGVIAVFDLAPPAATGLVSVGKGGSGTGTVQSLDGLIACGGDCSETYTVGTGLTLQAVAAAGSVFVGWTGAGCSLGDCVFTVGGDTGVIARFDLVAPPAPTAKILTAPGAGGSALVRGFGAAGGPLGGGFLAYTPAFLGGAFVAVGNVDGVAGREIITGAGAGGGPHLRTFAPDGTPRTPDFYVFTPAFSGGVRVAAGDVDGDGVDEVIVAAGPGGPPLVRVMRFDATGAFLGDLASFMAYAPAFTGGVWVAAGDVDGDGLADIITGADAGGGPHVRAFSLAGGLHEVLGFYAFAPAFAGGVRVAAGDVDGSGRASMILGAGPGGGPHVRVLKWTGAALVELASFMAYDPRFPGGVHVAAGDVDGDTLADVITGAGAGGGPHVRVFTGSGADTGLGFMAYEASFSGAVAVSGGP